MGAGFSGEQVVHSRLDAPGATNTGIGRIFHKGGLAAWR